MCEDAPCCGCCPDIREIQDYREEYEAELAEQEFLDSEEDLEEE
jgi:hypothetical protein